MNARCALGALVLVVLFIIVCMGTAHAKKVPIDPIDPSTVPPEVCLREVRHQPNEEGAVAANPNP